jgi:hypothetical protein
MCTTSDSRPDQKNGTDRHLRRLDFFAWGAPPLHVGLLTSLRGLAAAFMLNFTSSVKLRDPAASRDPSPLRLTSGGVRSPASSPSQLEATVSSALLAARPARRQQGFAQNL